MNKEHYENNIKKMIMLVYLLNRTETQSLTVKELKLFANDLIVFTDNLNKEINDGNIKYLLKDENNIFQNSLAHHFLKHALIDIKPLFEEDKIFKKIVENKIGEED